MSSAKIYKPEIARNPNLSDVQKSFERWARRNKMSMGRNHMVPYTEGPWTHKELFEGISIKDYYYDDKTQGAWDGWRARDRQA